MRHFLASLLLLAAPAMAATFDNGKIAIAFQDAACDKASLTAYLEPVGQPKKASVLIGGKVISACYIVDEDGDYLIVDENGAGGFIPKDQVKGKAV